MIGTSDLRREEALARLVYISLPPALDRDLGGFRPDQAILLPVEPAGRPEDFDPRDITAEAMVAGMLRLLAWRPDHENAAYFRDFILVIKPDLLAALTEAGIVKARSRDWEVAEEVFLALIGLFPEAPEPLIDLAVLYEDYAGSLLAAGEEEASERLDDLA